MIFRILTIEKKLMTPSKVLCLILIYTAIFSNLAIADQNNNANNYTITIIDAKHHLANVTAEFNGIMTKSFSVKLPVWRTGRYEILNLSKNIRNFSVYDANDNALTWQKDDKNTWRIFLKNPGKIKVKYQIYANMLRERVSHIDSTHAFLDASGVFVYSESQRDKALTVKLNVPNTWRSFSGLETIAEHTYKAENYDVLVDSPIETGINHYDSIQVEKQLYEIVIWGDGNFDMQKLKNDIQKYHYEAKLIWKTFPFTRYVYMFHAGHNLRGATEHLNSTIIQTDRFGFAPEKKYNRITSIMAHEFVHTWNVKSYRPAGITPYDYSKENYSDLFWMAEGITSYYDLLLPYRIESFTTETFLTELAKTINSYQNKPGREVMSLSETSFDTWMKNNKNRSHNTTVSIYQKGSLVSWLFDKRIRELTNNKKNMDDLQYHLYEKYANSDTGYRSFQVLNTLEELTGDSFKDFWKDYVDGTKPIDFIELLNFYGLQFEDDKQEPMASFNVKYSEEKGLAKLDLVDNGGAAWLAGLTHNDVLLAIDGYQVTYKDIKDRVSKLKIGQNYSVHYFSQGILKETQVTPTQAAPEKLKIVANKKATRAQKEAFKSWTRHDLKSLFDD